MSSMVKFVENRKWISHCMAREGWGKIRGQVTAKGQGVPSGVMEMLKK